ncbi:MAG: PhoH family protein [Bacteroidota bacterium]|nr:PhoH family protein [Bacteroidota bacterium]|tara:strand:- start:148 stop:1524 length:1377 start_codon:yes stop_codon:yes gene_type:complete
MTSTPPNTGTAPTPSLAKVTTKTFVLDTSVLLFDHSALSRFEEHQVAIPITVLEELDQFKVGNETKNFEARECIRIIDRLSKAQTLQDWIDIDNGEGGKLKIVLHKESEHSEANQVFGSKSNDHRILDAALKLQKEDPSTVVTLVTKDINLRLKAKALELPAEDYKNGQVRDVKLRFTGKTLIEGVDADAIRKLYVQGSTRKITMLDPYRQNNHYYVLRNGSSSALGYFSEATRSIERIDKDYAYGIKPRNAEQAFALHAITNPDVSLVTICGVAGTGKTLLALAGALEQRNRFDQIILARPIVALSNRDIGFLPGDAEEKINPYMQPLWDNLNFIKSQFGENERKSRVIEELKAQKKITICPLAYIRGRSLTNAIFIIDEAQNLTPHEVKTIITRAGENCKIILTGDVRQIDTPYLDEQSNGLSYVIDRLRGKDLYAHITLEKGERSDLANLANTFL